MTQPAVTFQVRQLEEHFNTRLFDRTHNRISLTDAGSRVFEYADRIFELYAEMENGVREITGEISGALTIGAIVGEKGWQSVAPFAHEPFKGVLCLFLLDMGLIAARRLGALRESGRVLLAFAIVAPLAHAAVEICQLRVAEDIVERQHAHLVAHLLETGQGLVADATRRRILAHEFRVRALEFPESLEETVVLGVRNRGRIEHVVAIIVQPDLVAQILDLAFDRRG